MDINEFFAEEKICDIKVNDQIFKYKITQAGDELDWADDYIEDVEEEIDGKKVIMKKQNLGKLSVCKLRNIVEVPFTIEQLTKITKLTKAFSKYTGYEKDALFRKLSPNIYNALIKGIDALGKQKKD